ncbi:MAG: carbohydrate ABC transporter permease [Lachnospiraceae bacterium]|nr:carbohydrate ABC transporter permease [Lachnospiraceae bacterium]
MKIRKSSLENIIFTVINTCIMMATIVVMLYPFWNTIAVSFNDAQDTLRGGITFFPRIFSTYSYEYIFKDKLIITAAVNSVLRTVISTVLGVVVGSLIAYVLSRKELVGRKFFTSFFLITMYVSAGLIPSYFLIKDLGLLNRFAVYILPGVISVYNIIVIKSFMQGLPESLTEAAMVDGAGHFRCYWQIVMPCCKPVLATIALWCAVGAWNQWFDTFLYASGADHLTTLQYEMMKLLSSSMQAGKSAASMYGEAAKNANTVTPASMRAAITVVASVPILVVYPFVQGYFVKGVTLGATKG